VNHLPATAKSVSHAGAAKKLPATAKLCTTLKARVVGNSLADLNCDVVSGMRCEMGKVKLESEVLE
jgi:hypothetical protein